MLSLVFSFLISDKGLMLIKKKNKSLSQNQKTMCTVTRMIQKTPKLRRRRKVSQIFKVVFNRVLYLEEKPQKKLTKKESKAKEEDEIESVMGGIET